MADATLKTLFRCKLEFAHAMIDCLPEALQEPIRNTEKELLRALQEKVKDFLEDPRVDRKSATKEKGLRAVKIDE